MDIVESMVKVTQTDAQAIGHGRVAAKILETILLEGISPLNALKKVAQSSSDGHYSFNAVETEILKGLESAVEFATETSLNEAAEKFGRSCHLPDSLKTAFSAMAVVEANNTTTMNDEELFKKVVEETILQGGCNASRAGYVGACIGAWKGVKSVPEEWTPKFTLYQQTLERAQTLAEITTAKL